MRKLTIDGTEYDFLRNWSLSQALGSRTTFTCTVLPPGKPRMYEPIVLTSGSADGSAARSKELFSGIITKVTPVWDQTRVIWQVSAADYSRVADYRLVSFAVTNMTAEDIVTTKLLPVLASDGITAGTISAPVMVKKAVFNFKSISEALTQLATLCGGTYYWKIENKLLSFLPRSTVGSQYDLMDGGIKVDRFTYSASSDDYRNIQYVKGAKGTTDAQTETLTADGSEYTTRYPVALQPNISVNGAAASVGVSGLDGGTTDFSWSYDSRTIKCNLETVPGTITITYIGLMTIYTRKAAPNEINRIAQLSGGSGIREALYVDETIDTVDAASQYCDALLEKYARDKEKITFTDSEDHWHIGELVYVWKLDFLVMGYFLVTERKIKGTSADDMAYEITMSGGSEYDGWVRFFEALAARPTGSVINADEVATILENVDERTTIAGSSTVQVVEYPTCSASLTCSDSLILGTVVSSDIIGG